MPKIVAQYRKRVIPYLYTLRRTIAYAYTLPNAIGYLNTCIPYLNTCITYLNTLTRLSAPYPNTLNRHDSSRQPRTHQNRRQPIRIEYYVARVVSQSKSSTLGSRQPIRIEHSRLSAANQNRALSAANQNRVLSHPSRHPMRIEHPRQPIRIE